MRFQYLAAAVMAATVSGQATSATDCPQTCLNAYNTCRGAPDSNKSSCAAQYASCLGYSPFGSDGSLITPTACSASSTSSVAATSTVSATPTANACVTACLSAYNTCRGAPGSNKATCAAQYAGCLGFNPFGADGSLITPTACSAISSSTAPSSNATAMTTSTVYATSVYTVTSCAATVTNCPAKMGQVTTEVVVLYTTVCPVSQVTSAPTTMTTSASSVPSCPAACLSAYHACRGTPNSNKATCAAQYAGCLGFNPFGADGSLITPTACSAAVSTTASATPYNTVTVKPTVSTTSYGTVTVKPTTTGSLTQFTGAAGTAKPLMGLLALGALAML